jgi:hypothetical protein
VGEVEGEFPSQGALNRRLSPLVAAEDDFSGLTTKVVAEDLAEEHVSAHESPSIFRKAISIRALLFPGVQSIEQLIKALIERTETAPNPDLPGRYLGIDWSQRCDPRC